MPRANSFRVSFYARRCPSLGDLCLWLALVEAYHRVNQPTVINILYICLLLQNKVTTTRFVWNFSILVNEFHCLLHSIPILKFTAIVISELWGLFIAVMLNITCSPLHNFKVLVQQPSVERCSVGQKRECCHYKESRVS